MGKIGYGYGSECHLLRYLGRHRNLLDAKVAAETASECIEWIDFDFDPATAWGDGEPRGLGFLPPGPVKTAWQAFWPSRGNPPNWDAVARIEIAGRSEWLLVEAKGNVEELNSSCGAKLQGGRAQIEAVMTRTKDALGVAPERDWLNGYYQFANRLAVLHFLTSNGRTGAPAIHIFLWRSERWAQLSCDSRQMVGTA
jgi:hypothetical protein